MQKRLLAHEAELLIRFADPDGQAIDLGQANKQTLSRVIEFAQMHGVLHTVGRRMIESGVVIDQVEAPAADLLRRQDKQTILAVGQTMLLDHHATRIASAFKASGVQAVVVKGPAFAASLYRQRGDRLYTDIDFLVAPSSLGLANTIIAGLGFSRPQKIWDNASRDQEYKWLLDDNRSVLVELQGNLVHYPALRRHVSFGFDDWSLASRLDPRGMVTHLLVAVIHSSCGHKFHKLNMLVDVLQAARKLEASDEAVLDAVAAQLGAKLELGVTLAVVAELFNDARVQELANRFADFWSVQMGRKLISPTAVLSAPLLRTEGSRGRRHLFRQMQQLGWVRP